MDSERTLRPAPAPDPYDVVIIGGALSGSAVATLLKRSLPSARLLIVERRVAFDRKVGEATVEVSGFFLHRVLGLYDHLSRHHLPKHGLRFWFTDRPERRLAEMSEIGPTVMPHLPSFQLDRARLDEHVLDLARREGAEIARPARVLEVSLDDPGPHRVTLFEAGRRREVSARWVIDASGRRALLGRQLGLIQRVEEHPTAAVWSRWRGVQDLDGPSVLGSDPQAPRLTPIAASRRLATNHFCGYGWWCWVIPLGGGETSVGLVYDKSLFELPGEGSLAERYQRFLIGKPGLRELLAGAEMEERDCRGASHLPYRAERYAGRGWALVGDAASFLDPFYSPGLDHLSISAFSTVRLVEAELSGEPSPEMDRRIEQHNARFDRSYRRWLQALYLGKYELLGDAELTSAAFLFDTAMYYLGVVTPVYSDLESLGNPVLGLGRRSAKVAFSVLSAFNRRLNRLARFRARVGTYGRRNAGWRVGAKSPDLGRGALPMLRQGLAIWWRVEGEYLRYRLAHRRLDLSTPAAPHGSSEPAGPGGLARS